MATKDSNEPELEYLSPPDHPKRARRVGPGQWEMWCRVCEVTFVDSNPRLRNCPQCRADQPKRRAAVKEAWKARQPKRPRKETRNNTIKETLCEECGKTVTYKTKVPVRCPSCSRTRMLRLSRELKQRTRAEKKYEG
jgi:Zn finger protein HypA/HybF involved in hydrogenase expression